MSALDRLAGIWHILEMYHSLKVLAWIIGGLSSTTLERLAKVLAFVVFDLARLRRRLVLRNLALAFPEKSAAERLRIGRASIEHFVLTALEFLRSSRTDIAGGVEIVGADHLLGALARGQGAYILCCHLGNWEAMGAAMTRRLTPSYVLVKKVGGDGVNRFVAERREQNGFLWVRRARKGDGFRGIMDILGRGEVVGFVMDQARPGEPKLPFFGHPAKTNTSFAAIWRRCPAPIIPGFIVRHGVSRHRLEFLPEVAPPRTDDEKGDVERHSILFNQIVEGMVRRAPEQYFWMHNRWK